MVDETNDDPCADPNSDCGKATALVDKYIDDLLDDSEKMFVSGHLSGCPGCTHGFEFESSFHIRVQSISPIQMPIDVKENIMLALGFPGMTAPISGSFSALGAPDAFVAGELSSQFGIPKGEIPRSEIPKSEFFRESDDSSSQLTSDDD